MIRLRLLGTVGLQDEDDAAIPLTAPKRFALLAYLALGHRRGGSRSRDEVMAVFWPDLDAARARAVLRQTLRLLRIDLGKEVVESRGSELALSPAGTWCDVTAFDDLLDAGAEAEALELYSGSFLAGFHYPRSSWGFEEWREEEARRLQERATQALWKLVDAAGEGPASERTLRRLLQISPYDEPALRRLMRSLAGRGNRAEAVQLYEAFTQRLASELEADPSPETRTLADAVRSGAPVPPAVSRPSVPPAVARPPDSLSAAARSHPATREVPTAAPGTATAAPALSAASAHPASPTPATSTPATAATAPPPSPPAASPGEPARPIAPGRVPRRFRVTRVTPGRIGAAAVLAALVLAGSIGWGMALSSRDGEGRETAMPLVVLPFGYRGDPDLGYLAAGIAGLVGDNLDGAGPIRTIGLRSGEDVEGDADAVARRLGARLYLTGDILEAGGRVRVRATLHDPSGGAQPEVRVVAEGAADDVFTLADRVATTLLREAPFLGAVPARSAALTTTSLPALRAYLEGEERLRNGRYDEAIISFEAAIRLDTAFALAFHRLGTAAEWAPRPDLMTWASEASMRHIDRLPLRERSLLEAALAWRRGEANEAERRLREILRMYPDDGEAWFHLGEVLFHHNPLQGRLVQESETAWRRVLARDPENLEALVHLARVLSIDRRLDELPPAFPSHGASARNGDRRLLQIRALGAVDSGSPMARSRVARDLRRESDVFWVDVWYVLAFSRNLAGTEPLLDLLTDPRESVGLRLLGHVMRAHVRVAQGRWEEARVELAAATALDPATGLAYRGYLTTLPFVPPSAAELQRLRSDLVLWDPHAVSISPDPRPAFTIHAELWPLIRRYLIGAASIRLGDLEEAESRARELAESAGGASRTGPILRAVSDGGAGDPEATGDPYVPELARDLALGLRARIAVAEGRPAEALELLEETTTRTTFERAFLSPFHARAAERHLRGEVLTRLGRDREALRWFDSAAQVSPYELAFLPFSHVARARIHERAGEHDLARRHFLEYRALWSRADHAWREEVERELRGAGVQVGRGSSRP